MCLGLLFTFLTTYGQIDSISTDTLKTKNFKWTGYPVAFFLPETGFGGGVAGITTFRFKAESPETKPSNFQFGVVYTAKKQILLFLPFELFLKNETKRVEGELGYYRYFYNYFGIGNDSKEEDLEFYHVNFPRLKASYLKQMRNNFYGKIGFSFDQYNIQKIQDGGILEQQNPEGIDGGSLSNLTLGVLWDGRDNLFSPTKGEFLEVSVEVSNKVSGSNYDYARVLVDVRKYIALSKKIVLANQLFYTSVSDNAPFFAYPYLSTSKIGRGFADRRFQDRAMIVMQHELRLPLFWRFKLNAFISYGNVAARSSRLLDNKLKISGGLGLRFVLDKKEKTTLRVDLARSTEGYNFYFTANEAF